MSLSLECGAVILMLLFYTFMYKFAVALVSFKPQICLAWCNSWELILIVICGGGKTLCMDLTAMEITLHSMT
jgi:hypothetical protein